MKYIIRRLWKNKLFTSLNIIGLAIGISACWVVFRLVNYEFSFEKNQPQKEQVFKMISSFTVKGEADKFDGIALPIPKYIKENMDQVELVVPTYSLYVELLTTNSNANHPFTVDEPKDIISTTKAYFELVPYQWLAGNKSNTLDHPNEVVLTESRVQNYFPGVALQDVVGQTIKYDTSLYTVTGVVKDLDYPSTFNAKEFIRIRDEEWNAETWTQSNSNNTLFLKLKDPAKAAAISQQMGKKWEEMTKEQFNQYDIKPGSELIPLKELHFNRSTQNSTNINLLYGLMGIGLFLLLLACVNYINLSTAQVPYRAKEIGIRKTLGEQPNRVTRTFIQETFMICLAALFLSWPISIILQKSLSSYVPTALKDYSDAIPLLGFLLVLVLLISLLASLYPAYLINRVRISEVIKMKGSGKLSFGSLSLRKVLIIFQFVIAQGFVIGTFIMAAQLKHNLDTDLGFNTQAIININFPYKKSENSEADPLLLKNAIAQFPEIQAASLGHLPMNNDHWGTMLIRSTDTGEVQLNLPRKYADEDYVRVFDLKLLAGRSLTRADSSTGFLLNEMAIQQLGFANPAQAIGENIKINDSNFKIVGVLKNFHIKDLHQMIEPMAIFQSVKRGEVQRLNVLLSADKSTWEKTLANIEGEWKKIYPNAVFSYDFYDDRIKGLYESDYKFSKIINLSSAITILLSCLGLIGLVTITTTQRTKEIGVRKVMGSSVSGIVRLLSKDYLKLVIISILIASPIAWWAVNKWLEDFAYKIEISGWMFVIPAVLTLCVAFLTMSYQSIKAAKANPVDSLKDE